jgi:hypothetical protein
MRLRPPRHTAAPGLIAFARSVVRDAMERCAENPRLPCLAAVDGTCGNGHDTLFLARTLCAIGGKPCGLFSFDVQPAALAAGRAALDREGLTACVRLLLKNHARLARVLERAEDWPPSLAAIRRTDGGAPASLRLAAAMYNLGFLPGGDKRVVTTPADTLVSLQGAAAALAPQGILTVHAYGGHPGGMEELRAVEAWCAALPFARWTAARYALCNKARNPEALFLVAKKEES